MTLQWISCNLHTGDLNMAMPALIVDYPVQHTIGQYDTATAHLIIEDAGVRGIPFQYPPSPDPSLDWWYATVPGVTLLACYDDEDTDQTIQWGGFVNSRTRNGENNVVDLSLATVEAYMDRCFVASDRQYDSVGEYVILEDLLSDWFHGGPQGIPYIIHRTGDGDVISQSYSAADVMSLYDALTQLSARDGGPEWEMHWSWRTDRSGLDLHIYIADRIGSTTTTANFEMPGSIISVSYTEDYSAEKGANAVRAYPTTMGIGPSDWQELLPDPYARARFNYQVAVDDPDTTVAKLNRVATRAVNRMQNGAHAVQLTADRRTAPVFCRDWNLGDNIAYRIGDTNAGQPYIPVFPFDSGLTGTQRVIAVQIAEDTIMPIANGVDA